MKTKKYNDENSYILSMSDIMAGLIFVFIILLAVFLISLMSANEDSLKKELQYQAQLKKLKQQEVQLNRRALELEVKNSELEKLKDDLEATNNKLAKERNAARGYLSEIIQGVEERKQLLKTIKYALQKNGLTVDMDFEHGVMRLGEDAILFPTGEAALETGYLKRLNTVSSILAQILPCYSAQQPSELQCLPDTKGMLNSVFIEGHTDNVPIRGALLNQFASNRVLSTARANYTFNKLVDDTKLLKEMVNPQFQPIFSVSGYGDDRPVKGHEYPEPTSDPKNRRIDFRFIMSPPSTTEVEEALEGNFEFSNVSSVEL
ncbi:OmpA family protein [uncultured Ferrimonas sp.]|uniref:OmpA family protein n=1 Tax=uncultured Ferrimonas sp. TaxID=432640 RepID=UPI00262213A5|nr:OmpA family protein [uncultured Ferrimonas sp.]